MKRCLRITITAEFPKNFLQSCVQKNAKSLNLEGTAQFVSGEGNTVLINICGSSDLLEEFLDLFHKSVSQVDIDEIEIEPFLKDKDYRAVFRIIE